MDSNNQKNNTNRIQEPLKQPVLLLGFQAMEMERFKKIFQTDRQNARIYAVVNSYPYEAVGFLLVNYDNPTAVREKNALLISNPNAQVIAVSRGPLNDAPDHHIRGMLMADRVLSVLDRVSADISKPAPAPEQTPVAKTQAEEPAQVKLPVQPTLETQTVIAPVKEDVQPSTPMQSTPMRRSTDIKPAIAPVIADKQNAAPAPTETSVEEISPPTVVEATPAAVPVVNEVQTDVAAPTETAVKQAVTPPPIETPPTVIPVIAEAKPSATSGYRALVVDDSPAIQKSIELNLVTLEQIGAIDFADSGESAIEMAEANRYDLIFLDIMMPGIDGYETCTRLRKKPEYKKTPIIMVSGKTSPLDEVKGIMAGATTYLTKPVQKEQFQKVSGRVLAWLAAQKTG
jgi:CheY-like chemotaxis protein